MNTVKCDSMEIRRYFIIFEPIQLQYVSNGSGTALRQFMYVEDFASIVKRVILEPLLFQDLICAPKEENSIAILATLIGKLTGRTIEYDEHYGNGQHRKYARSINFDSLFPDFHWTSLVEGIEKTIKWYKQNKNL